jgi:hypothetical protein
MIDLRRQNASVQRQPLKDTGRKTFNAADKALSVIGRYILDGLDFHLFAIPRRAKAVPARRTSYVNLTGHN